jgi:hypothetical protein
MKTKRSVLILALLGGLFTSACSRSGDADCCETDSPAAKRPAAEKPAAKAGQLITAAEAGVSAEWLAKAVADYPLDYCMVSDDNLEKNDMGPPQNHIYRQDGQPDQLVRLCCNHCVRDFKKSPAKHMKIISDAAKAKTASTK